FNDILYLTSTGNDSLYRLDLQTGDATLIGAYGDTAIVMHGLEIDERTGKLYGASSHNGGLLYEIDRMTGAATLIGGLGIASSGTNFVNLGFNSANNTMYATASGTDSFYTVDVGTGLATLIGPLNGSTNPNALAYNWDNGLMYLVDNTTDNLYTIDLM